MSNAMDLLGLKEPFTSSELKAAFRAASMKMHPDRGGTEEQFHELTEAYKELKAHAKGSASISADQKTVGGELLSSLGKGYPLTVSAVTCTSCSGKGYQAFEIRDDDDRNKEDCEACHGSGLFSKPCAYCKGSGKYKPRNGKQVDCKFCQGSGRYYPVNTKPINTFHVFMGFEHLRYIPGTRKVGVNCNACSGDGKVRAKIVKYISYSKCHTCDGIGETKIYNPVIPRGFLMSGKN